MSLIKHKFYIDYPEQPYISKERDLKLWESNPEKFPYSKVERKQMIRLEEGILPGDLVLLWRINFDNFTNESVIPQYFEYRYGLDAYNSLDLLINLEMIREGSVIETLDLITSPVLKRFLKDKKISITGKKEEILNRVKDNFSEEELSKLITLRKYKITPYGIKVLNKYYDEVIIKHGPKM